MADGSLMGMFGPELNSMIDALVAEELDKTDLDVVAKCYHDMASEFDDNVTNKLPEMQKIFKQLDEDVTKMEKESSELNKELAKFSVVETQKDDPLENSETSILKPRHSQRQQQQAYGATPESRKVEEMRKYVDDGKIQESALRVGLAVLGKGKKEEWKVGEIIEIQKHQDKLKYKVLFNKSRQKSLLYAHQIACLETPQLFRMGQIVTGSRVAAVYNEEGLFSGVVAEAADKKTNKGRFLIFFDDGYALYCAVEEVFLVYGKIKDVWNDISYEATSKYIKDYLSTPERHMLSLKEGQTLKVEFNGEWHRGRVTLIDCSLVEILYLSDNSRELVYRGSMRLQPLFQQQRTKPPNKIARAHTGARRNLIEIVDITGEQADSIESSKSYETSSSSKKEDRWEAPWARTLNEQKRMSNQTTATRIPNSFTELSGGFDVASRIANKLESKSNDKSDPRLQAAKSGQDRRFQNTVDDGIEVDSFPLNLRIKPQRFTPHQCSPRCVEVFSQWTAQKLAGVNPLIKPLLCGWTRDLCRIKPGSHRSSFHVYYRTPCGRACRTKRDVGRYMRECRITVLDYDHFSFDHTVRAIIGHPSQNLSVIRPRDAKIFIPDYARGKEDMAISCVNEISMEEPPKMPYTKVRIPGKGVEINTNSEFMICCDCPDNCRDRSKCPCQQLTVQATSCSGGAKIKKDAGYQYKRLYSFLPTGIYECNSRCKCNRQCENRVVQKGLQCRLQMFKTQKKGWGIRCVDDIERGSFVCIYTGKIQTESNANTEGLLNGDEYLAELDHIEVAESQKDDYNSDVSSGFNSGSDSSDSDSDKVSRRRDDSTDTDEDTPDVTKEKILGAVTVIGGPTKKLGYSVGSFSPPLLPENLQKRRGKVMVMRKPSGGQDKSDQGFGQSRTSSIQRDEDTTDTDSDIEPVVSRPPTARKSTTSRTNEKRSELQNTSDTDTVGTRRFFGSPGMFIIDAKQTGNLGRYLNHSCTPNLMVQNVFIDTHDLRFPWVAFFAGMNIRSGTELTWDYNYEIGSVPERVIHCYCGSTKCRKRLL